MALYLTLGTIRPPAATKAEAAPHDEEIAVEIDLEEIEDVEDKEATARLAPAESQRLLDAAFPKRV